MEKGIVQLKDGEESEVNRVTFTVELLTRTVRVNGAEQQRGGTLLWWSV